MKHLIIFLGLVSFWMWGAEDAHACSCQQISPAEGFDRAQFVFTGTVIEAGSHTWVVDVDRVWKGRQRLTPKAKLMDVYAAIDCEFFFKHGERYIVFAILAKGGRDVFYHPQVCNLTRPLQSTRVSAHGSEALWLEELVVREHGPGEPPLTNAGDTH